MNPQLKLNKKSIQSKSIKFCRFAEAFYDKAHYLTIVEQYYVMATKYAKKNFNL